LHHSNPDRTGQQITGRRGIPMGGVLSFAIVPLAVSLRSAPWLDSHYRAGV
jgi:hypothetical protein